MPRPTVYRPTGHAVHALAPSASLYVSKLQSAQVVLPAPDANRPTAHTAHDDCASAAPKKPGEQGAHSVRFETLMVPAKHAAQLD